MLCACTDTEVVHRVMEKRSKGSGWIKEKGGREKNSKGKCLILVSFCIFLFFLIE